MQLGRAVIFGTIECDQHVTVQATEFSQATTLLQGFERRREHRIEVLRRHRVKHVTNMVIARNLGHPKQRLAIRVAMPMPLRQMPLMRQERWALHEEHRERCHADIGHRVMAVLAAALVRQTRAGLSQRRYQALDRPHSEV